MRLCVSVILATLVACTVEPPENDLPSGHTRGTDTSISPADAENAANAAGVASNGLPCDVDELLAKRCRTCHSSPPQFGAGTSLVTWDDLQKSRDGKKVLDLVKDRINEDASAMPPSPQPHLDAKELATLDDWIAGGAKKAEGLCSAGRATPSGVKPLSCKPDTTLKPKKPIQISASGPRDLYLCYGAEVSVTKKRHVTAFAPKLGNKKIVHHILLFRSDLPVPQDPFPCDGIGSIGWKLVAGWAPGGDNLEMPPEAGYPENPGGAHWVVQVHYNTQNVPAGTTIDPDETGYDLCTTDELRANDAGVLAFGSVAFAIPPRATETLRCDYALPIVFEGAHFFNSSPHMHKFGAGISLDRIPFGSTKEERIYEQKDFSFEAQTNTKMNATVHTGDILRTRCTWKNTSDQLVTWGEATDNEMCFDFVGYYPYVPEVPPAFTWATPSWTSLCVSE